MVNSFNHSKLKKNYHDVEKEIKQMGVSKVPVRSASRVHSRYGFCNAGNLNQVVRDFSVKDIKISGNRT